MPPRYASPYHASPATRRPQEGHAPGSATAPQQSASLSSSGAGAPTSSHPLGMFTDEQMRHHRRSNSGSSTTSSLSSVGGVSLGSIGKCWYGLMKKMIQYTCHVCLPFHLWSNL
jgi:hypothetical protein